MVDQQLRAPLKEFGQGGAAVVGIEAVRLVEAKPWQCLALPGHIIAASGQRLFRFKQLQTCRQPLFPGRGFVGVHRCTLLVKGRDLD
ncbi:hypothetical protein D9M73_195320 [compost metagenome]